MADKTPKPDHWPFQSDEAAKDAAAGFRAALERKKLRESVRAANREHMRHDRLIVGGRAHTRKPGLS